MTKLPWSLNTANISIGHFHVTSSRGLEVQYMSSCPGCYATIFMWPQPRVLEVQQMSCCPGCYATMQQVLKVSQCSFFHALNRTHHIPTVGCLHREEHCIIDDTLTWNQQIDQVLMGCGMGPWLVLVSPCFTENVVATCKIGSFLCSLDNLLEKNVIVLFFGNQI